MATVESRIRDNGLEIKNDGGEQPLTQSQELDDENTRRQRSRNLGVRPVAKTMQLPPDTRKTKPFHVAPRNNTKPFVFD